MIKSLTVTNHLDESIKIVLGDSDTSGFLITNIEGLGPCKATINSTEMATGDGSIFNSSRLEPRNIVISMTYDYRNGDIESIRQKSYKYFPIKKRIKLHVETGNRSCEIYGYVESNEPLIFSPMEGSQISILCPDPYFYSSGEAGVNVTEFGTSASGFKFPFSNKSLTEPTIEFGRLKITDRNNIPYDGDSEIGLLIRITMLDTVGDISISDVEDNSIMTISASKIQKITGSAPVKGDIIIISTVRNNKYIQLLRSGKYYNILNALDRNSAWFVLYRGDNVFSYSTSKGRVQFRIENRTIYEGV